MAASRALRIGTAAFAVALAAALWTLARADRPGWFLLAAVLAVAGTLALVRLGERRRPRSGRTGSEDKFRQIFETMADGYY